MIAIITKTAKKPMELNSVCIVVLFFLYCFLFLNNVFYLK